MLLARALVCDPDLLLLDEPTNHLDIDAIQWVEQFLLKWEGSLLFISHDRRFMNNLANRFIEIDRGQLAEFNCNYATYLQRKEEILEIEDRQNALFDKRLSQEEVWIRQGIKARRTRNEGGFEHWNPCAENTPIGASSWAPRAWIFSRRKGPARLLPRPRISASPLTDDQQPVVRNLLHPDSARRQGWPDWPQRCWQNHIN